MIADGEHELPDGALLRVWTQFADSPLRSARWCCIAYDHGPLCRRCQPFDEITEGLYEGVMEGHATVRDDPDQGPTFSITEKGERRARQLLGIKEDE